MNKFYNVDYVLILDVEKTTTKKGLMYKNGFIGLPK